jgi:putative transposase
LKRLQKKLSRQEKGSKNRNKTINKIQRLYQKQTNVKENISNQIVSFLLKNFKTVVIQDEMIVNWHKGLFGKKIQHSILGRIKSKLKQSNQTVILSKSFATTKTCSCCGQKVDMKLSDRVFKCEECGIEMDRDIHAAQNMIWFYERSFKVPMEHRDLKPVEMETSAKLKTMLNNVSYISVKQETDMSLS